MVLVGIGEILMKDVMTVPPYQRSYAWNEQNVRDLLQDVTEAIDAGQNEYFVGTIVLSNSNPRRPEIVDGQQRLTTTLIIIAAIRDSLKGLGDALRAKVIDDTYISTTDLSSLEKVTRLSLNQSDHPFFQKFIVEGDLTHAAQRNSHEKIKIAYETALAFVNRYISTVSSKHEKLISFVDFLRSSLKVIKLSVHDQANAYTIFETLNDRGVTLSVADLLKNFLFGKSKEKLPMVQAFWNEMVNTIEDEEKIVNFMRHYWSSIYGLTREKELFKKFKEKIVSPLHAYELGFDLVSHSHHYTAILNSDHWIWEGLGPKSRNSMKTLNEMGLEQIRPLILAVLRKFSNEESRKAMTLFLSWSVRFSIVGGYKAGSLDKAYADRAVEIRSGAITTASELLLKMNGVVPSDEEFYSNFLIASVTKSAVARYFLRTLEDQYNGNKEQEFLPNPDAGVMTLEHILPQNPSEDWAHFDAETVNDYYQRIGNLALLTRKVNAAIGNNGFSEKKSILLQSGYALTKIVAEKEVWGIKEIEDRQNLLAKLAIKAWPNQVD
jgi:Protein of unknown function DUF262/Protein of unknown function (DUF1524)